MYSTKDMKRLYHEEKYSVKQVADILGCSPSLVASRLGDAVRSRKEAGRIRSIHLHFGIIPSVFKD
ncbi:sigma-70 family RNA polymerase sigma factor [Sporosarcina sp. ANT_H38]|uniref:sigma-70 family RNA polymerase sigma factor n=1 Tax=Sporosarcina sp. ANT_H38 TaxID=2597358 RepID=UPI0011F3BC8D|nr:sigma-70 family RNA polymerase sigma factor [Sporosarcina sp. ANT_H38]KAA0944097.1 sigma-70 family RNA polymerase sigma factor [Sporosarcina sp. ANT_H38]